MSAQTKILLVVAALIAFVIGAALNWGQIEQTEQASALLNAELEKFQPGQEAQTQAIREALGSLNLVNFWATWCAPCREEMPLFESMYRLHQQDGFRVLGIAIDNPERAQPFLDSLDISYPILYAEQTGMTLMEQSGNPQGLLPYSLLIDDQGVILEQKLGVIDQAQIQSWIDQYGS